jgi:8-amino-7-oxononanoate synthase
VTGRLDFLDDAMDRIASLGRRRALVPVVHRSAVEVEIAGRPVRLFSSNDYLGLSFHPEVRAAAECAARDSGMGPRGASLICGYTAEHEALERDLASLAGTETALLFPTGFAANLGVVTALGGEEAELFSDSLNHASIIDGCRLSRAAVSVYRHADVEHLDELLASSTASRRIVVTETVFSMDGDIAPLAALAAVCERHEAILVTDEAHATLVFGDRGAGVAEATGVASRVDVHIGTLSKAVGAQGGFVATSARVREYLLNVARAYVFTTSPVLPVVAAARAAIRVARETPELRARLWERVAALGVGLGRGLASPIAPIVVGDETRAVEASRALLDRGFHVTAIRPPTVPSGGSRLRVTVSAAHGRGDITELLAAIGDVNGLAGLVNSPGMSESSKA